MNQSIEQLSQQINKDKENYQEYNYEFLNPPKIYPNSDFHNTKKFLVKGQHLVKKLREVRDMDRRVVMSEIETA
jgi:hypothetical protein